MSKYISIIDKTSRQYQFSLLEEGSTVRVDNTTYNITPSDPKVDVFFDAIANKKTFMISSKEYTIAFSADSITGVILYTIYE